jgi:hypothetical protein
MKGLTDSVGSTLEWIEPKAMQNFFELRDEAKSLYASFTFRSTFGSFAVAETAHGTWTFKRVGFLNPGVTVRLQDATEDLALYRPRFFSGGELAFVDGLPLRWQASNIWQTQWSFLDSQQQEVVSFAPGPSAPRISDFFKTQATVAIQRSSLPIERSALLVALGFYLIVLHQRDAAVVVIA